MKLQLQLFNLFIKLIIILLINEYNVFIINKYILRIKSDYRELYFILEKYVYIYQYILKKPF